jgi:peptidoglycan/LPS O-acetylase OafA/YrhL
MPIDIKPLTALRFWAAVWVVAFHYWPHLAGATMPVLVSKGYLGVELFFTLSGFILAHVYLQAFGDGRFRYGGFLWARLARIYPLHLATLAAVGVLAAGASLAGVVMEHEIADLSLLPAHLTLLHAWGVVNSAGWNHPSWSISAEWFAYLSFPAFALVAWRLKDRPRLAVGLAAALVVGLYSLFFAMTDFPLTKATFAWGALRIVPCFALGCAINLLWRSGAIKSALAAKAGAALSLAAILALGAMGGPDAAMTLCFGGLILSLASLTSTGSRLMSGRVGVYLGEVSYAVYMVCFPWELVATHGLQRLFDLPEGGLPPALWAVLVLGVVPVAMLAHHLVERPARTAMRRYAEARKPARAAAA